MKFIVLSILAVVFLDILSYGGDVANFFTPSPSYDNATDNLSGPGGDGLLTLGENWKWDASQVKNCFITYSSVTLVLVGLFFLGGVKRRKKYQYAKSSAQGLPQPGFPEQKKTAPANPR
jgi:hypothetical protein